MYFAMQNNDLQILSPCPMVSLPHAQSQALTLTGVRLKSTIPIRGQAVLGLPESILLLHLHFPGSTKIPDPILPPSCGLGVPSAPQHQKDCKGRCVREKWPSRCMGSRSNLTRPPLHHEGFLAGSNLQFWSRAKAGGLGPPETPLVAPLLGGRGSLCFLPPL